MKSIITDKIKYRKKIVKLTIKYNNNANQLYFWRYVTYV